MIGAHRLNSFFLVADSYVSMYNSLMTTTKKRPKDVTKSINDRPIHCYMVITKNWLCQEGITEGMCTDSDPPTGANLCVVCLELWKKLPRDVR